MGRKNKIKIKIKKQRTGQGTQNNKNKASIRCVDKLRKLSQEQPATSQRSTKQKKKITKTQNVSHKTNIELAALASCSQTAID
jgi:hypothetical protein